MLYIRMLIIDHMLYNRNCEILETPENRIKNLSSVSTIRTSNVTNMQQCRIPY